MRTESFVLEGVTYYAEKRKCSKPGCRCGEGELHGPYWYSRDPEGHVSYVGKHVPENVLVALAELQRREDDIRRRHEAICRGVANLTAISDALLRLANRWSLRPKDRDNIRMEGFGTCLVSPGGDVPTQDS